MIPPSYNYHPDKIISGGQTGADQGGLAAAIMLKIPCGGTAPPNFMTDIGPDSRLKTLYNLTEGEPDISTYRKRTIKNVTDSDGTAWFGETNSPGGRLTLGEVGRQHKPLSVNQSPEDLRAWCIFNNIKVLNVAGNRERKNPGIFSRVRETIYMAFRDRSSG